MDAFLKPTLSPPISSPHTYITDVTAATTSSIVVVVVPVSLVLIGMSTSILLISHC